VKILQRTTFQDGVLAGYLFWCPGCQGIHPVNVGDRDRHDRRVTWGFNGNEARPTFTPSLLVHGDAASVPPRPRCHSFIRDGQIEFLSDSGHELAGKTVPIPSWRGWDNDEEPQP
jgi:hypothetical protein